MPLHSDHYESLSLPDDIVLQLQTQSDDSVLTPGQKLPQGLTSSNRRSRQTTASVSNRRAMRAGATWKAASDSSAARSSAETTTSDDILFKSTKVITINNHKVYKKCGKTIELEDEKYQNITRHVCVLWNHVPEEITLKMNKSFASYNFLMTIDEDFRLAKQEMMDGKMVILFSLFFSFYFLLLCTFELYVVVFSCSVLLGRSAVPPSFSAATLIRSQRNGITRKCKYMRNRQTNCCCRCCVAEVTEVLV